MSDVGGIAGAGYGLGALQAQIQPTRPDRAVKSDGDGDGTKSVNEFPVLSGNSALATEVQDFGQNAGNDLTNSQGDRRGGLTQNDQHEYKGPPQLFSRETLSALLEVQEDASPEQNGVPVGIPVAPPPPADVTRETKDPNSPENANGNGNGGSTAGDLKNLVKDLIDGSSSAGAPPVSVAA